MSLKIKSLPLCINSANGILCAVNIEKNLKKMSGIIKVSVDFISERIWVEFVPETISFDKIYSEVRRIEYSVIWGLSFKE